MANSLYDPARQAFARAGINWETATVKLVFVDAADYTINLVTHDFLDDIPAIARVATSGNLANKVVDATGRCDADDITVTSVTGDQFELIIAYVDTGVESTSRLIFAIDTATGLPFTPAGTNVQITWGTFIFRIGP